MSGNKHVLRPFLLALVALALIAGACGSDDDGDTEASSSGSASASASASEPASASGSASASASEPADESSGSASASASEPADDEDAGGDAGATVTVTDVIGEKEVPITDENIYALDEFMGTMLLTLGIESTTAAFFEDPLLAPVLEAGAELVPFGSVESVAVERPDIILGIGHPNLMEIETELAGIAPVVLPDFTTDWKDQTRLTAQVVGREAEADAVIAAVEARTAELAAELDEAGLAGSGAAIVQNFGGDYFFYGPTTVSGAMLADLGFTRSEAQSGSDNFGFIPIGPELVPEETSVPYVFSIVTTDAVGGTAVGDDPLIDPEGRTVAEVAEGWSNNTALGAWIVLNDIEAIVFERGEVTGLDGATAAFEELLAAAGG